MADRKEEQEARGLSRPSATPPAGSSSSRGSNGSPVVVLAASAASAALTALLAFALHRRSGGGHGGGRGREAERGDEVRGAALFSAAVQYLTLTVVEFE